MRRRMIILVAVAVLGGAGLAAAKMGGGMMGQGMQQGMHGGMGPGMMGGMMGGYGWQGFRQMSYSSAEQLLAQTTDAARVDKAKNQVSFSGDRIEIAMAAVQRGFPDTAYEMAGLVNHTIIVPAGALVTLDFVKID